MANWLDKPKLIYNNVKQLNKNSALALLGERQVLLFYYEKYIHTINVRSAIRAGFKEENNRFVIYLREDSDNRLDILDTYANKIIDIHNKHINPQLTLKNLNNGLRVYGGDTPFIFCVECQSIRSIHDGDLSINKAYNFQQFKTVFGDMLLVQTSDIKVSIYVNRKEFEIELDIETLRMTTFLKNVCIDWLGRCVIGLDTNVPIIKYIYSDIKQEFIAVPDCKCSKQCIYSCRYGYYASIYWYYDRLVKRPSKNMVTDKQINYDFNELYKQYMTLNEHEKSNFDVWNTINKYTFGGEIF